METKIIALTASSFEEERVVALAMRCDHFLPNPLKEKAIFQAMHQHAQTLKNNPSELLTKLKDAAVRARITEVEQLIECVHIHDETIAKALAELASEFQFQKIATIIHDATLET